MKEQHDAIDRAIDDLSALLNDRPSLTLTGSYSAKGANTLTQILQAAREVFVEDGHANLSLRKVARRAGVGGGNLSYYFKSKQALLHAMLKEALADYVAEHVRQVQNARQAPIEIVLDIAAFYVGNARETHDFFLQLWGYAGADPETKDLVRTLYQSIGRLIIVLVRAANPALSQDDARRIMLQIFGLEEGMKLFIALGSPDRDALPYAEADIRRIARQLVEAA